MNKKYKFLNNYQRIFLIAIIGVFLLGFKSYTNYKSLLKNGWVTVATVTGKSYGASTVFLEYKFRPIGEQSFYNGRIKVNPSHISDSKYLVIYDTLNHLNNFMILKEVDISEYEYGDDLNIIFDKTELGLTFWKVGIVN